MGFTQNQIDSIPAELKALPQWVAWRYEKRDGQEKPTKVPYNPATGQRASAGQPQTWAGFDTAVNAANAGVGYDGIGFQFNGAGLVGVDIDHCIDPATGEIEAEALFIVGSLDSYTELSPSGTGLHIFVYGDIPAKGRKHSESGVEVYKDVRYLTMTGRPFGEPKRIEQRPNEIMQLYNRLFPDKGTREGKPTRRGAPIALADRQLVETASNAKNGDLFRKLFAGDWQGRYKSQSEADLALCNILAFYTVKDEAQIDRVFRASGLMRPKWDEKRGQETYGAATIRDACQRVGEPYRGAAGAFAPVEAPSEWEKPIPFDSAATPGFPTESLPPALAALVECLAESTQTPEEMAGILSLGVLSTAYQSKYEVEITSDWREPLCLYAVAVAPPGERKSAVISALSKPIYEYEAETRAFEAAEIAQNQTERALLEKALQAAQSNATKKKGSFEACKAEAMQLAAQLSQFEDKHPFRLLVDDTTPEKLVDIMDTQNGCIAVASAEGGVFDIMAGRYDKGANFDVYLKGHAGDPITVDRIGRKPNHIPRPRLTMMLTIQPEVLQGLMNNATFRGRGLCGRFLFAMCKSKVGRREISPEPVPDQVKADYRNFVRQILSDRGAGVIRLSPEADQIRKEYAAYIEQKLGDEWESMRDWGGKLVGAMVRIAAVMHAAETSSPAELPISPEVMQGAVRIAEFLGAHAVAAYQVMGADENYEDARYLWRRIQSTGQGEISKRDLFAKCQGHFKRVEEMEPSLQVLVEMEYIREIEQSTGGRPTKKILVNPLARGSN